MIRSTKQFSAPGPFVGKNGGSGPVAANNGVTGLSNRQLQGTGTWRFRTPLPAIDPNAQYNISTFLELTVLSGSPSGYVTPSSQFVNSLGATSPLYTWTFLQADYPAGEPYNGTYTVHNSLADIDLEFRRNAVSTPYVFSSTRQQLHNVGVGLDMSGGGFYDIFLTVLSAPSLDPSTYVRYLQVIPTEVYIEPVKL